MPVTTTRLPFIALSPLGNFWLKHKEEKPLYQNRNGFSGIAGLESG
jgi:hypothetical protein